MHRRRFLSGGITLTLAITAGCVQAPIADESPPTGTETDERTPTATQTTSPTQTQGTDGSEEHVVELTDDLTFVPDALSIAVGDTIVWENSGSISHSVTAYDDELPANAEYFASGGFETESGAREAFPEGEIQAGDTYTHMFETPGTYGYFCIPHEQAGMTGTITVE